MNKPSFQISEIAVEQFATFTIPETDSKRVKIDLNLDLTLNDEKRVINCSVKIVLRLLEEIIITLQVKCAYSIDQEKWEEWIDLGSGKSDIPIDFVNQIADLTVATARGILYAKTENTKYNTFFIPILDLTEVIKETQK